MADLPGWGDAADQRGRLRAYGLKGLAAYEDAVVCRVLAGLGMRAIDAQLAREAQDRTGAAVRSFALLDEMVPDMPVQLRCGKLAYLKRLAVPDLFDRFTRTPIYLQLAALVDDRQLDPTTRPAGMVFRWAAETVVAGRDGQTRAAGIRGGKFMAIHTYPTSGGKTRIIRDTAALGWVTIETLDSLLGALAGWARARTGYA